jgi:hypothetical protein
MSIGPTTSRLDGVDPQGQPMGTAPNKGGRTWKWFNQGFRASQWRQAARTMAPDVSRANR